MHGNMVQSARVVKCAESNCNHADFSATGHHLHPFVQPREHEVQIGREKNHCLQIGLASQEQRWGIEGASCGVALGDSR